MFAMNLQPQSQFLLKQRITPLVNRYEYFATDGEGKPTDKVAFVAQKRFSFKEEVTAWSGEDRSAVVFKMKAEKVMDVHGKYWISGDDESQLGYLRKVFGKSLLRSTWEVYNAQDQLLLTVQEANQTIALVRRFGGLVPIIGDLLQLLPFNFEFLAGERQVGFYKRQFSLRDEYLLTVEPELAVDRRLLLALGIALDALQSR